MNDTQLYLTIGIPSILIILAWISNKSDISSLRAEIATLRSDMRKLEDTLRAEMGKLAENLRAEMNALRREIHSDMIPLHERLAVVESKQSDK